jgi:hypothetical protein
VQLSKKGQHGITEMQCNQRGAMHALGSSRAGGLCCGVEALPYGGEATLPWCSFPVVEKFLVLTLPCEASLWWCSFPVVLHFPCGGAACFLWWCSFPVMVQLPCGVTLSVQLAFCGGEVSLCRCRSYSGPFRPDSRICSALHGIHGRL